MIRLTDSRKDKYKCFVFCFNIFMGLFYGFALCIIIAAITDCNQRHESCISSKSSSGYGYDSTSWILTTGQDPVTGHLSHE